MVSGAVIAGKMMTIIANVAALALCITQTFIDSAYNDDSELVFENFSLMAKSVSCFKLFITAYHAVHTEGSEMLGFVCLIGFFLLSYLLATHLNMNLKAWARSRIVGMATFMATGVFLLCRGMVIPKDHACHTVAVPVIVIFTLSVEAGLLIHTQQSEDGDNQHFLRDLLMKLVETLISIYRCADLIRQTRNPWDGEKILNLVGSGLPVLIGACHVSWIAYRAGIVREAIEWLGQIPRVFAREEQLAAGTAVDGDGGADAAEKMREEGVEVLVVALPASPLRVGKGEN